MQKKGAVVFLGMALLAGLSLIFTEGCYYDNEEDLYPELPCDTTDVRYSTTVQPVIQNYCYPCHSNAQAAVSGAGVSFEGYQNLVGYLNFAPNVFLGAINREPGFPQMPKNSPKMKDCDIRKIEIWIEAGKPNN